jgi:NAD+ synthase (glutamine-hydrolysing)
MMPSPWTAQMSLDDSREMVRRLGVQYDEIPIAAAMEQFAVLLAPTFAGLGPNRPGIPRTRTCRRASAACC